MSCMNAIVEIHVASYLGHFEANYNCIIKIIKRGCIMIIIVLLNNNFIQQCTSIVNFALILLLSRMN